MCPYSSCWHVSNLLVFGAFPVASKCHLLLELPVNGSKCHLLDAFREFFNNNNSKPCFLSFVWMLALCVQQLLIRFFCFPNFVSSVCLGFSSFILFSVPVEFARCYGLAFDACFFWLCSWLLMDVFLWCSLLQLQRSFCFMHVYFVSHWMLFSFSACWFLQP